MNIKKEIPLLHKALHYPDGEIRLWPLRFAGDTWDEEIMPFRATLIKIQQQAAEILNQKQRLILHRLEVYG